jgi:uncharacterized protein YjgD (DUF1641 family)
LQELRETHLSKEQVLVKLKKMGEPDWRKSKLVFVISALETNRFDIEPNIDGLLEMINKLSKFVSTVSNMIHVYPDGKEINLAHQSNHVHLLDNASTSDSDETDQICETNQSVVLMDNGTK